MNTHRKIHEIFQNDSNRNQLPTLMNNHPQKDTNHVQRRQQQRAINDDMIKITLLYGCKHHNKGAAIYTLTDKILEKTPYAQFTDTLRGLRVVCRPNLPTLQILTAYWHKKTIGRIHH